MAVEREVERAAEQAFRRVRIVHGVMLAAAVVALGVTIVLAVAPGRGTLDDFTAPLMGGALAVVAVADLVMAPWLRRQSLRKPPSGVRLLDSGQPPVVAQLMTADILATALAFAVAVYGVAAAVLWHGLAGIPFCVVSILAIFAFQPRWAGWTAHLRAAARQTR